MQVLRDHIALINKIRQIELQISQIFHYSDEAIITTDDKLNVVLYNNGAQKIFGYNEEEVIGNNLQMLFPLPQNNNSLIGLHNISDYLKQYDNNGNVRGVKKSGAGFIAETNLSKIILNHGIVYTIYFRDVTEKYQLEKESLLSKNKYEQIIKFVDDAIISINQKHEIILFNLGAQRILGYAENEILGKHVSILIPEKFRELHDRLIDDFSKSDTGTKIMGDRRDVIALRKDGLEIHTEASIAKIDYEEEFIFTIILRDVSARKLLEKQFVDYLAELEKIDNEKDKYFTLIAHDLRNPLGNLMGFLDFMIDNIESLDKTELLEILNNCSISAKNIYQLLENMLDWTRIQMHRMSFSPEWFDPQQEIQKALSLYKQSFISKKITVYNNTTDDTKIYADANMFSTIIRNLISNAIKFSHESGEININYKKQNGSLLIEVADNGVGMEEEKVSKLFRTDIKESSQGTKGEIGFGLGLLMIKDFVELNNGGISVESKYNVGTRITVSFPTQSYKK
ncbi:MAG: PAS domain-containing sensor histidine kinase [Bacteroidetes bacterium]|nr:PAS domain-containing sensor histidine kinase [Bacteroidota bacterium]